MKIFKKRVVCFGLLFCFIALSLSPAIPIQAEEEKSDALINLSENTDYAFSYRGTLTLEQDTADRVLTKTGNTQPVYAVINDEKTSLKNGWGSNTIDFQMFSDSEPFYFVKNDWGFVSEVTESSLTFRQEKGTVLPKKVELYYSNDGYNFNFYGGELMPQSDASSLIRFRKQFSTPLKAKAVKYVIYAQLSQKLAMIQMENKGRQSQKQVLLSDGAGYTLTDGQTTTTSAAASTLLTDNKIGAFTADDSYLQLQHPVQDSKRLGHMFTVVIDLKDIKNISEVSLSCLRVGTKDSFRYVRVYSSTDGETYSDFSMSYPYNICRNSR